MKSPARPHEKRKKVLISDYHIPPPKVTTGEAPEGMAELGCNKVALFPVRVVCAFALNAKTLENRDRVTAVQDKCINYNLLFPA